MRFAKWSLLMVSGGLLLTASSCTSDFAYYLLNALAEYLPDYLDSLTTTTTA